MSNLRKPLSDRRDPIHHQSTFNWGRGDATSEAELDPELVERRKRQMQTNRDLQAQMRQNQERRERDRLIEQRRREKEEADLANYTPFGRGGAGAPLRNVDGDVMANLREVTRDTLGEKTRDSSQPPAVHNLLERTRPGAEPPARPGAPFMAPHQTPRAAPPPAGPPPPGAGLAAMYVGGPDDAYEKQMRQRKYVSELEQQMKSNQDRRQREAAQAAALDAKIEAMTGFNDQWAAPNPITGGGAGGGGGGGGGGLTGVAGGASPPGQRIVPPPVPSLPLSTRAPGGGGGGGAPPSYGGLERITQPWDGQLAGFGPPPPLPGGGALPTIAEGAYGDGDGGESVARYAEPVAGRGGTREEQLARMLEWERERSKELDIERRRERERERERDAARQREMERAADRQREWEQRLHVEESERRQREERRLAEEIASMRREFLAQQRQIIAQVEDQLARMRTAALAAVPPPPPPPAAAPLPGPSLQLQQSPQPQMPTRSTLLYADGTMQQQPSSPPPQQPYSPPIIPPLPPEPKVDGLLTAGMNVGDEGERQPEEIDRLLEEFLNKSSD